MLAAPVATLPLPLSIKKTLWGHMAGQQFDGLFNELESDEPKHSKAIFNFIFSIFQFSVFSSLFSVFNFVFVYISLLLIE